MESAVLEGLERSYERKSAHERLGVGEKLLMGNVAWTSLFAGKPAKRPLKALEHSVFLQEHLSTQAMTLHLFVERTAWQLQLFKHGLDVTLVSGERRAQALRLKGFLLGRQ